MGRRKSKGEVEEGYADFNGETTRSISFELKATGEPNFTSPPVVKLVCVERLDHLYKWFLFNRDGNFVGESASAAVTCAKYGDNYNTVVYNTRTRRAIHHTEAAGYGGVQSWYPYQKEYIGLDQYGTVGFSFVDERRSAPTASDTLYLYFQVWFDAISVTSGLQVYFGATNSTSYGTGNSNNVSLTYAVHLDDRTSTGWTSITSGTGYNTGELEELDLDGASNGYSNQNEIRWVRLTLTGANLPDLGKFLFRCTDSGANEFVYIANPIIQWGSVHSDGFTFNPNVGISFSSVTQSGMTIDCTAKLHGRIRYLMSL